RGVDTQALLSQLRALFQVQHEEDRQLLERLERRLLPSAADHPKSNIEPSVQGAAEPDPTTLIGSVERLFQSQPEMTWSVEALEKRLRKEGFAFEAKNPRASLNTAVSRLAERRVIEIYTRGSGRKPHLYRALRSANSGALRGRMAATIPEP